MTTSITLRMPVISQGARRTISERTLEALFESEVKQLSCLASKVLRSSTHGHHHAESICRLCDAPRLRALRRSLPCERGCERPRRSHKPSLALFVRDDLLSRKSAFVSVPSRGSLRVIEAKTFAELREQFQDLLDVLLP